MLSFFDALNLILDDKAADHDDFKNILLLGDVEEKRIMSLAKRNKISNINFLDLNNEFDAGSLAAFFTNLTNDDTLIIKYNQYLEEEQKEILYNAVKYRKIKLIVGEGNAAQNVEIDLNEFNIILSLGEGSEIFQDFYDMFPLKIAIGENKFDIVESGDIDDNFSDAEENSIAESGEFKIAKFYGTIDWFNVAEQPDSLTDLPDDFDKAYKLWSQDKDKNFEEIINLIEPYLNANFVIPALNDWENIFVEVDGHELEAASIKMKLVGVDFSVNPIPQCKAEAWFEIPIHSHITNHEIDEWQDVSGSSLTDALSFSWNIDQDDLDFSCGDHMGVEVVMLQDSNNSDVVVEQNGMNFKMNAAWERRDGRAICRYMIVWKEIGGDTLAGTLGGYSGGGSFQMEQFFARREADKLLSLMIDNEDKINGQEIDFYDDVPEEFRAICDDAQDILLEWNDQDEWEEDENLVLRNAKEVLLSPKGDMLFLSSGNSTFLKQILMKAGITAAPSEL